MCLQKGHLPHTLSLSKAFDLSFTPTEKLSVRRKKGVRWCAESMACGKTTETHLTQVAVAAFRSATGAADEAQAEVARRRESLKLDAAEQPDGARGAIIARASAALSGTNARAAVVRNPRAAVYHSSLATGLSAGMAREMALLYAGASRAGVDFDDSMSGDAPTPLFCVEQLTSAWGTLSRRSGSQKLQGFTDEYAVWAGPARPSECKFPLFFSLMCVVPRHMLLLAHCAISQPVCDFLF